MYKDPIKESLKNSRRDIESAMDKLEAFRKEVADLSDYFIIVLSAKEPTSNWLTKANKFIALYKQADIAMSLLIKMNKELDETRRFINE